MPSVSAAAPPLPPPRAPSDRKSCARRMTALSALVCGGEQESVRERQGGGVFERDYWSRGRRVGGSEPREQGSREPSAFSVVRAHRLVAAALLLELAADLQPVAQL